MLHIQLHSKKGEGWALPGMTLATADSEMSIDFVFREKCRSRPATEAGPGQEKSGTHCQTNLGLVGKAGKVLDADPGYSPANERRRLVACSPRLRLTKNRKQNVL